MCLLSSLTVFVNNVMGLTSGLYCKNIKRKSWLFICTCICKRNICPCRVVFIREIELTVLQFWASQPRFILLWQMWDTVDMMFLCKTPSDKTFWTLLKVYYKIQGWRWFVAKVNIPVLLSFSKQDIPSKTSRIALLWRMCKYFW
jgi:hypothetical protein